MMDDLSWILLAVQAIGMLGLLAVGFAGRVERENLASKYVNDR
ncbi:MAG: hypothetical protein QM674_18595 [Burkholderiaceae bacterium]